MGAYTKLQAINEMLLFSGETPVDDLAGSSGVDTSIAESILAQKTIDAQARGLANNIGVRDIVITSTGKLSLPTNILSAELLDTTNAAHADVTFARVVTRGWETQTPFLFNLTDNTELFPAGTYTVEVVYKVNWENMDTAVQKDIMMQAARQYQMLTQGDGAVDNYLAQLELYYGAKAKGADTRSKGYNLLDLNKTAYRAVNRAARQDSNRHRKWNLEA